MVPGSWNMVWVQVQGIGDGSKFRVKFQSQDKGGGSKACVQGTGRGSGYRHGSRNLGWVKGQITGDGFKFRVQRWVQGHGIGVGLEIATIHSFGYMISIISSGRQNSAVHLRGAQLLQRSLHPHLQHHGQ